MKLKTLYIKQYKNLKDFTLDFEAGNGLSILIGNNGAGKSNVIEAISGIFHDLFKEKNGRKIACDYTLKYVLNDVNCKLEQRKGTLRCYGETFISRDTFIARNTPNHIVGLYSGEEDRLWTSYYESYYKSYIQRIKTNRYQERMRLMLVNKYYWNIALLILLLSENETLQPFLKEELGIKAVSKITMGFRFQKYDESNGLLKAFIDSINPEHKPVMSYSLEELRNHIYLVRLTSGTEDDVIVDHNGDAILVHSGITDAEVFRYLIQAYMPKADKLITSISIAFNDDLTLAQLSEGEKKLILVKTVLEILSDEKTLILMDEPDAHLHETRKKNLFSMMNEYPNRQIVIASHSPTFIEIADMEQIQMLKTDASGNAMLYAAEKIELIRELTGSRINAFLEKPILYCEGSETSVESILYPALFPDYKVIHAGGHEAVIHLTKMYNRTFADATHYAVGIIDWDYKTEAQLTALREEKIYPLSVVEVENVLMDQTLLEAVKESCVSDADCVEQVKKALFEDCSKQKERQAAKYTSNQIASQIQSDISPDKGTIENIKQRIQTVCDLAKIDALYQQRIQCLDDYIKNDQFEDLVKIYDFNHKIDRFTKAVVDRYQTRILRLIQRDEALRSFIKSKYYPDIP